MAEAANILFGCRASGRVGFGVRRSILILGAVFVVVAALVPGVAMAGDPIPPTGHWLTENPDSTPALPSIVQVRISDASPGTDDVRVWLRDSRATGACATTQGPAEAAGVCLSRALSKE